MKVLLICFILVSISWCSGHEALGSNMTRCNSSIIEWLPHPESCEKCILCFHGNPIERNCAPGLQFNSKEGKCILSQERCCPQVDNPKNPLFSANINDCTKYSVCFSGEAISRSCGQGLFFDVNSNWCTTPNNVTCDSRTTNNPKRRPLNPIDLSKCHIFGNAHSDDGTYVKSVCYYNKAEIHSEAITSCHKLGMRLLRIEDSAVQTATIAYLLTRLGVGNYHVGGTNNNGTWYHDDNTPVYENMRWKNGKKPELENLAFSNFNPWSFESYQKTVKMHSICEFNHISHFN